jgi:hypothetical protein
MRGDALAQLNVLTSMSNVQEYSPRAGQHIYIDVPLRKEPLSSLRERQTRLSHHRQTQCPRLSHMITPRVHELRNPTVMNSSDRRVLRFWPQCPSR